MCCEYTSRGGIHVHCMTKESLIASVTIANVLVTFSVGLKPSRTSNSLDVFGMKLYCFRARVHRSFVYILWFQPIV